MIIKITRFLPLYFFCLSFSLFSQNSTKEEATFLRFQNYYLEEEGKLIEEDFIISKSLYEKRHQSLIVQDNSYYLKSNTFLRIPIDNLLPSGELLYQGKVYRKNFHMFIKESSLNLTIKNTTAKKELRILVDDTPPLATLFLANFFRKKNLYITNNPQATFFLTDTGVGIKENVITFNQKKILPTSTLPWVFPLRLLEEKNLLSVDSEDLLGNQLKEIYQIVIDNQGPQIKLQITEEGITHSNFIEKNYSFVKEVELSFALQDNYGDSNQLYVSQNIAEQPFILLPELFLKITEGKTIYYYAEDQLKNVSSIKKILFKKKENNPIITL